MNVRLLLALLVPLGFSVPGLAEKVHESMMLTVLVESVALIAAGWVTGAELSRLKVVAIARPNTAVPFISLAAGTVVFWMLPINVDAVGVSTWLDVTRHATLFLLCGVPLGAIWTQLLPTVQAALFATTLSMVGMMGLIQISYANPICTLYTIEQQRTLGRLLLVSVALLSAAWVARLLYSKPSAD